MFVINARFLTQPLTGVQRFAIEISRALKKLDPTIRLVSPKNGLHPAVAEELGVETYGVLRGHLWEQLELPRYLRRRGSPLLLSLAATGPLAYRRKIVTVHDLAFHHFPDAVSWRFRRLYEFLLPRVLATSRNIATVSEFSKQDLVRSYGVAPERITVVYNASSFISGERAAGVREPVIIAVGSLQRNKNLEALISAFIRFQATRPEPYLLKLVGGIDHRVFSGNSVLRAAQGRPDVIFTGWLNDAALLQLYSTATCFVFPSLFEGFGIPPLEAMACGCPVIASTATAIPEVCGDAALYCDPHSVPDIAQKITRLVDDGALRAQLVEKGYRNVERFSWQRSAQQLYRLAQEN